MCAPAEPPPNPTPPTAPAPVLAPAGVGRDLRGRDLRGRIESAWVTRLVALAFFVPTLAVLLTASSLTANDAGMGTHTQLGLAPCGFQAATGFPCATCGMTTAFTHAADGRLMAAFVTQPAGLALAILTAMVVIVSGWSLATAMPLAPLGRALWRPSVVVTLIALVLGGWLYTVAKTVALN